MGADLYINMIYEKTKNKYEPLFEEWCRKRDEAVDEQARKVCQEKVTYYYNKMNDESGYFRDSYNDSNLLWCFGLDYWEYFASLLDKGGILTPEKAQELLDNMKSLEPVFNERLPEKIKKIKKEGSNETEKELKDYFIKKYFQFQRFLKRAIELKSNIDCSI